MDEQAANDADDVVARLESALERIARLAGQPVPAHDPASADHEAADAPLVPAEEIASRLDGLIDRLRVALTNNKAG